MKKNKLELTKGKHFVIYMAPYIKIGNYCQMIIFEGEEYRLYDGDQYGMHGLCTDREIKYIHDTNAGLSTYYGKEYTRKNSLIDLLPLMYFGNNKFNKIRNMNIENVIHNIDDFKKEEILKLKKKDVTSGYNGNLYEALFQYFGKTDLDFKISVYEKNWIYNNELFYDRSVPECPPVKFSKEQITRILNCKQFNSSSYVMGGTQMQKQNALNHLLKTQELTDDLLEAILEKYEDDQAMLESTFVFIIKSKKVKTTADVNNLLAEKIVYNEKLHELVKVYKKKFGTNDVKDDGVKLLLECIE